MSPTPVSASLVGNGAVVDSVEADDVEGVEVAAVDGEVSDDCATVIVAVIDG